MPKEIENQDHEGSENLPEGDAKKDSGEIKLSEDFQLALDRMKRSTDIELKINTILPDTLRKIDTKDPQERAKGTAILMTLAEANHENVRLALARELPEWAAISPEDAGQGALKLLKMDSRVVNIALAEGIANWIDINPAAAKKVAKKLAQHKGMGVNLALADGLPDWADLHADITGLIAKKLAKDYNHLNAVTNLLEKTYGKDWASTLDDDKEENKDALMADLVLTAAEHVEAIKVSLASGLPNWAGLSPDDAEEVTQILVDEIKQANSKPLAKNLNAALIECLAEMAEEHPKTTARLAAVIITNPDPDVIDDVLRMFRDNPTVDPNPAHDAVKEDEDYHNLDKLSLLANCYDQKGESHLLEDLGL